jgi:hypothetical protein|tara:strand:- start:495 stop:740 length:246 start_codon:yes stop_codon:yes gene_type:complete
MSSLGNATLNCQRQEGGDLNLSVEVLPNYEWAKSLIRESRDLMEEMKIYVPNDVLEEMGFQDCELQVDEFLNTITNDERLS